MDAVTVQNRPSIPIGNHFRSPQSANSLTLQRRITSFADEVRNFAKCAGPKSEQRGASNAIRLTGHHKVH